MSDNSGRLSLGPAPARKSSFNAGRATIAVGYDETLVGDPFDISGYLQKRGEKWSTAWRRRWFEIKDGKLYYYKSHVPGTAPQGTIPLEEISQVYACEDKKCEGFAFELATQKRIYYLAAESPADRRRWVDSLTLVRRLVKADRMGIPRENVAPLGRPTVVGMPPYAPQGTAGDTSNSTTSQRTQATAGATAGSTVHDEEYQFSEEPVHGSRRSTIGSEDQDNTTPSSSPPSETPVKKQDHNKGKNQREEHSSASGGSSGSGGGAVAVAGGAAVVAGGAAVAVAASTSGDKKANPSKSSGAQDSNNNNKEAIVAPPPREPPPMNEVLRQILTEVDDSIIPHGVSSDLVGRILMEDATRPYTRSPSTSSAGLHSPSAHAHTPTAPSQTLAVPVTHEGRVPPKTQSTQPAPAKATSNTAQGDKSHSTNTTPTTTTKTKTNTNTNTNASNDNVASASSNSRQSRSGTKDGSDSGAAVVVAAAVGAGAATAVVVASKNDSASSKGHTTQAQPPTNTPVQPAPAPAATTAPAGKNEEVTLVKSTTPARTQDEPSQRKSVSQSQPTVTQATSNSTTTPAPATAATTATTGASAADQHKSHRDSVTSQGSAHDQPVRRRYQSFTHPDESDDDDNDTGKDNSGTARGRGSVHDSNNATTTTTGGGGDDDNDDDDDDGHVAIPAGIAGLTGATSGAGGSDGTTTTGNVIDSVAVYHEPAPIKPKPMFHAHFRDLPPLSPHTLLRHLLEVNDAIEAWVRENIDKLMAMTEEGMKPPLLPKNLGDQIRPAAPPAPQEKATPISIEPQPGMPVTTAGTSPTQVSTSPNDDGTSFLARKKAAILQKLKKKNSQQDVTQGTAGGAGAGQDGDPFGSVESEAGSTGTGSSATPTPLANAPAHDHKAHVVAYGGMPMQQHRRFDISGAPELAHSLVSVVASILMNGLKTEGIFGRITLWQCIRKFPNPAVEALLNYVEGFVWEGIPDVFSKYMRAALFIQIGLNQGWLFTHFARLCNSNPNFFDWYDPSAILRNPGNRTLFFNCLEQIQQKFLVTSELDTNLTLMYLPRTSLPPTLRLGEAVGSKCLWSHGLLEASLNADLIERLEAVVNNVGRLSSDVQAASALVTIQSATEDKEALDKMEFKLSVMVRRELADVLAEILLDGFKHFKIFGSYSLWDIFEFQAGQDKFASANLDVLRFTRSVSAINATVQNVPDMSATQKADMKFRSVICAGLNNQHLHVWIQWLVNNLELNAKFFEPWSMFRNPLVHERILILLEVLSNIQFRLPLDFELRARRQVPAGGK